MSDRTDIFASAAQGVPDAPPAAADGPSDRTQIFANNKPLPVPKTPGASEPEPDTWFNAVKGLGDAGLAVGSSGLKAVTHAVNDILPGADSRAALEKEIQTDPVLNYHPQTEGGKTAMDALGTIFSPVSWAANKAHEAIAGATNERTADIAGDVGTLLMTPGGSEAAGAVKGAAGKVADTYRGLVAKGRAADAAPALSAEDVLAKNAAASPGNMGAAEAAPSLEGVSPELKDAISKASNIHSEALNRHIDAETLPLPEGESPMRLRAGQATRDDQQISDEKNLRGDPDTQGILSQSITDQNAKLGMSMGEIRRRANPDIVQLSSADHGQTAVDAIKAQDNATVLDTRTKYKALEDAAGGAMPIDTGETINQITDRLKQKLLTKTAAEEPAISEVMGALSSGQPMSFETFNSALSNLAEVQRNKGSAAAAATVVRNALESMPLSDEATHLKGLRDIAAAAAKKRFDTIEQNPAYEAAINDNVPKTANGLHRIGAPSPLADTFMDRYFLGNGQTASRAYVGRIKQVMQQNPDFSPAIEASALNKLRDSAKLDEFDEGQFASANFRNTHKAMAPKADALMSPQTVDNVNHLRKVSDDVSYEGKASTVNRSNTALTLQRYGAQYPETPGIKGTLADYGTDLVAAHMGPVPYGIKKIGSKLLSAAKDAKAVKATQAAKLKFAQDATAPGAGIDMGGAPRPVRASGGKVDHDALLKSLMDASKAQKAYGTAKTSSKPSDHDLPNAYYRIQHSGFNLDQSFRSEIQDGSGLEKGTSAMHSLGGLLRHDKSGAFNPPRGNVDIVAFEGKRVDTGSDGEPVVIPTRELARWNHLNWNGLPKQVTPEEAHLPSLGWKQTNPLPVLGVSDKENPSMTNGSIPRATGGRVDHEALLGRLIQRYKAAKKMNDAGTETLLKAPDASIIRALDIAGRSATL